MNSILSVLTNCPNHHLLSGHILDIKLTFRKNYSGAFIKNIDKLFSFYTLTSNHQSSVLGLSAESKLGIVNPVMCLKFKTLCSICHELSYLVDKMTYLQKEHIKLL